MGTGSVESLQLVSNALQTVTSVYSDLGRSSQRGGIELIDRMVEQLSARTIDNSQEELIEAANSMFSCIENVFEVCCFHLHSVTHNSDGTRISGMFVSNLNDSSNNINFYEHYFGCNFLLIVCTEY